MGGCPFPGLLLLGGQSEGQQVPWVARCTLSSPAVMVGSSGRLGASTTMAEVEGASAAAISGASSLTARTAAASLPGRGAACREAGARLSQGAAARLYAHCYAQRVAAAHPQVPGGQLGARDGRAGGPAAFGSGSASVSGHL